MTRRTIHKGHLREDYDYQSYEFEEMEFRQMVRTLTRTQVSQVLMTPSMRSDLMSLAVCIFHSLDIVWIINASDWISRISGQEVYLELIGAQLSPSTHSGFT